MAQLYVYYSTYVLAQLHSVYVMHHVMYGM